MAGRRLAEREPADKTSLEAGAVAQIQTKFAFRKTKFPRHGILKGIYKLEIA